MKKLFITFLITNILFLLFIAFPAIAGNYNNYGLDETVKEEGDIAKALNKEEVDGEGGAMGWITQQTGSVIGAVLSFVGVIFLILTIYGGILWMTAAGNEEQVGKAKKLITSALIGLIIVFGAYAITAYIGQVISG